MSGSHFSNLFLQICHWRNSHEVHDPAPSNTRPHPPTPAHTRGHTAVQSTRPRPGCPRGARVTAKRGGHGRGRPTRLGLSALTLPQELVPNGTVALSLGKAHLSKLEDPRMSAWLPLQGCRTPKGLSQKGGCFGSPPLQHLVWPLHVLLRPSSPPSTHPLGHPFVSLKGPMLHSLPAPVLGGHLIRLYPLGGKDRLN